MVEKDCKLPDDPDEEPVVFKICGEKPACRELIARWNSGVDITREEFDAASCRYCLDSKGMSNYIFNVTGLKNWKDQAKDRCSDEETPTPSTRSAESSPD